MGKNKPINKGGRPTTYKPEYCQLLINFYYNSEGLPFMVDFCDLVKCFPHTFYQWVKKYPDFKNAYDLAQKYQEKKLVKNALESKYNSIFSIFTAKNVLGWRDNRELTGVNGTPLKIVITGKDKSF